jgi:hypothetical protein
MKHFNGSKTCACKLLVLFQHCAPHIPHVPGEHNTMYDMWFFIKIRDYSNPVKNLPFFLSTFSLDIWDVRDLPIEER